MKKHFFEKSNWLLIVIFIFIVLIGCLIALRFVSGEDSWLCSDGGWVKHGNPSASMPTTACVK